MKQIEPMEAGRIDLAEPPRSVVYRAYSEAGDLLYVGASDNLPVRLDAHKRLSAWYSQAATVEWGRYASRQEAFRVEAELIRSLEPPYNIMGKVESEYRPHESTATRRDRHRSLSLVAAMERSNAV